MTTARQRTMRTTIGGISLSLGMLWCPSDASAATRRPDFNGDGFADLVVAVPNKDIGSNTNAGAVHVIYGTADGLKAAHDEFWSQNSPGILDEAEPGDRFGSAVAWGDFNHDGFTDLAVGVNLEDIGDVLDAGAVNIIYGSEDGLTAEGNQLWTQDTLGITDVVEIGDQFGWSLASGDFDGDGFDDLAIGAIGEDVGLAPNGGAVHVLYGSTVGLRAFASQQWTQNSGFIEGVVEPNDEFGWSLAAGDFDGDGVDDLAIGVRNEDVDLMSNAGAVNVIYGTLSGLSGSGDQIFTESSNGIDDDPEIDDGFGYSLAAGDFDGDGRDDLAIGVPFEQSDFLEKTGAVHVLFGTIVGLTGAGSQFIEPSSFGGPAGTNDTFGITLATGDFDGDGLSDLAIGIPRAGQNFGAVRVLYGDPDDGFNAFLTQLWTQNSPGVPGIAAQNDRFGASLLTADFDGNGTDDLAVGVPLDEVGSIINAGAVNVIYGTLFNGLKGAGAQRWTENTNGINGQATRNDFLGSRGDVPVN